MAVNKERAMIKKVLDIISKDGGYEDLCSTGQDLVDEIANLIKYDKSLYLPETETCVTIQLENVIIQESHGNVDYTDFSAEIVLKYKGKIVKNFDIDSID